MNQIQLDVLSQGFRGALILWHNHNNNKLHPFIQNKYAEIIHGILNVFPTSERALIENSTFWEEWKKTTAFQIYSLDHSPREIGDPYPATLKDLYIDGIKWDKDKTSTFHRWSLTCQNKDKTHIYFIRYHFKCSDDFNRYGCFSFSYSYLEEGEGFKYLSLRSSVALYKLREIQTLQPLLQPLLQTHLRPDIRAQTGVQGPTKTQAQYQAQDQAQDQARNLQDTQDKPFSNRFSMLEFD